MPAKCCVEADAGRFIGQVNRMNRSAWNRSPLIFAFAASVVLLFGCATQKVNWNNRVGNYTFDQAVIELGPPERSAKLSDGRTVSEWLLYRGRSSGGSYYYSPGFGGFWSYHDPQFPDRYLRLAFSPEGRLENWKRIAK
jgi:hypothetical protein